MSQILFKKGFPWLVVATLLFLVSFLLYLYDKGRSDEDLLTEVQNALQEDFDNCLRYYKLDVADRTQLPSPDCITCELVYNAPGELISWSNNEYLPPQANVNRLRNFSSEGILELDNRLYFQTRQYTDEGARVVLIPLRITYNINNNFLIPFVFFGRWQEWITNPGSWRNFNPFSTQEIKRLRVGTGDIPGIKIYMETGEFLFGIYGLDINNFRFFERFLVVILFILGLFALFVYLRTFTILNWKHRYNFNIIFFLSIIFFRLILYSKGLPGSYIDIGLFSPEILAFNDIFIPSLGELSINILTLAILTWILYTHFFRLLNLWYRRIIFNKNWAWAFAIFALVVSSYLLSCFFDLFFLILENSQVEIEFSNLFETSAYSFLILLDIGVLLLAIVLMVSSLLKFNLLFAYKEGFSPFFVFVHLLILLAVNLYFYPSGDWPFALVAICTLCLIFTTILRLPFSSIIHYDPVNYLLLVLACSLVVTYCIIVGLDIQQQNKVERIVDRILGSQVGKTALAYETSLGNIDNDIDTIRTKYSDFKNASYSSMFAIWLKETYLDPNFPQFDIWVFLYNKKGERLDYIRDRVPSFGPEADPQVSGMAVHVPTFDNLYQLPNYENKYIDLYVGVFELEFLDDTIHCILELSPTRLETEGLYPSLSLDQDLYEDIRLINSFDHAVYRENILYSEKGNTPFPIYLEDDQQFGPGTPYKWIDENGNVYLEIKENLPNGKVVVVRYRPQGLINILTTFSFVFYFYGLSGFLLIVLPVLMLRWMGRGSFSYHMPIRSKIQLSLFGTSIFIMLVIVGFFGPFSYGRYDQDVQVELQEEVTRITNAIGQKYVKMHGDFFGRVTLRQEFADEIRSLEPLVRNDINIYNDLGYRIASTQPLVYERGLSSDLMNEEAFKKLRDGTLSDIVINEKLGRLSYFSAYRSIVGSGRNPVGYVNVTYIARKDQIDKEVESFLSFLLNIFLLVFLGINFLAVILSNSFTRPLFTIKQKLRATALGNVNKPIEYESKDEIGSIATAYNEMINTLHSNEIALKRANRELGRREVADHVERKIRPSIINIGNKILEIYHIWNTNPDFLKILFPKVIREISFDVDEVAYETNVYGKNNQLSLHQHNEHFNMLNCLRPLISTYSQAAEISFHGNMNLRTIGNAIYFSNIIDELFSICIINVQKPEIEIRSILKSDTLNLQIKTNDSNLESIESKIHENLEKFPEMLHQIGGKFEYELKDHTFFVVISLKLVEITS